ncbi:hypothetical protein ACK1SU_004579 [Salmonella enterica subsp. enterica serovar Infantis]
MKKTDELLKKKLIKQIQAISDNTHTKAFQPLLLRQLPPQGIQPDSLPLRSKQEISW